METLGSLIDKFSISALRLNNTKLRLNDSKKDEEKKELYKLIDNVLIQKQNLQEEIDSYLYSAIKGDVKLEEPKYKIYKGEKPSDEKFNKIGEAINNLFKANAILWSLEDIRRDKTKTDAEIRVVCDDVAKYNRIRNDTMDEINKIISELINYKKT